MRYFVRFSKFALGIRLCFLWNNNQEIAPLQNPELLFGSSYLSDRIQRVDVLNVLLRVHLMLMS